MKKTLTIILCIVLVVAVSPIRSFAISDDEEEIIDQERDVIVIFFPILLNQFLAHIDIISGSFYEIDDEPDNLYIVLNVRDFSFKHLVAIYAVHWDFNGRHYACGVQTYLEGEITPGVLLIDDQDFEYIDFSINQDEDSITWTIPKNIMGDPQPGEKLVQTFGWTGLRFVNQDLNDMLYKYFNTGEIAKDPALGEDYIIQY